MTENGKLLILVVDDEPAKYLFRFNEGWEKIFALTEQDAKEALQQNADQFDAVLVDLSLQGEPYERGLDFLLELRGLINQRTPFIVVTEDGSMNTYQKALDNGTAGFLLKSAYELNTWSQEIEHIIWYSQQNINTPVPEFITQHLPLLKVREVVFDLCKYYKVPIVIQGEPGVGKQYLSLQLPEQSQVLKLDLTDLQAQIKLLGLLRKQHPVILLSESKLEDAYEQGKLSGELYGRLRHFTFSIAPLRERPDDIVLLIDYFLKQSTVCPIHKTQFFGQSAAKVFDDRTIDLLKKYNWPYNVLELRKIVQFAIGTADREGKTKVDEECLPDRIRCFLPEPIQIMDAPKQRAYKELQKIEKALVDTEKIRERATEELKKMVKTHHVAYPDLFNHEMKTICKCFNLEQGFNKGIKILIWYASENEPMFKNLIKHFDSTKRRYPVAIDTNHDLPLGLDKDKSLKERMSSSDISIMMLCADFLASEFYDYVAEYIDDKRRHIPVITKPCGWESTRLSQLAPLPANGTPVSAYPDQDKVLLDIAERIRELLDTLRRRDGFIN